VRANRAERVEEILRRIRPHVGRASERVLIDLVDVRSHVEKLRAEGWEVVSFTWPEGAPMPVMEIRRAE
jgi:hypothetical protein